MPEHSTRERELYDHETDGPSRRRQADDWGIDESFPRVRSRRFSRSEETFAGPARRRSGHPRPEPASAPPTAAFEPAAALRAMDMPVEPLAESDERRTIRINGRPGELSELAPFVSGAARRRPPATLQERLVGDPTRIIAWAFGLGLLLILIAVATADAAMAVSM